MFRFESPSLLPKKETLPAEDDMSEVSFVETSEESAVTNEVSEQGISENTLSREMSPGEILDLAANLVAEGERKHAREAQGRFQEQVIAQRTMIREELMRAENGEGQEDPGNGNRAAFFPEESASFSQGVSAWMMGKLDGIPGGKKFLGGLALLAGLSALPEEGYANDGRYTIQNRHQQKNQEKGIFDGVFKSMGQTANRELERAGRDVVRAPRKVFDQSIRKLEQQDREREMAMKQVMRQQEQDARNQERAAERHINTVSREIVNFKRNFDRASLQAYRSLEDRNTNILRVALDSLNKLETSDNEYLAKHGGDAYGLSRIARDELSSFVRKMEGGEFSQAKHIPNPLREVSLERFLASRSSSERGGNRASQEDAPRYISVNNSEDERAKLEQPSGKEELKNIEIYGFKPSPPETRLIKSQLQKLVPGYLNAEISVKRGSIPNVGTVIWMKIGVITSNGDSVFAKGSPVIPGGNLSDHDIMLQEMFENLAQKVGSAGSKQTYEHSGDGKFPQPSGSERSPDTPDNYGSERLETEYVDVKPVGASKQSESKRQSGQSEWDMRSSTTKKSEPKNDSGPVSPLYRF